MIKVKNKIKGIDKEKYYFCRRTDYYIYNKIKIRIIQYYVPSMSEVTIKNIKIKCY